jgi:TRAP-type mannitol/chloroaromatic compound transport system permease small subunit
MHQAPPTVTYIEPESAHPDLPETRISRSVDRFVLGLSDLVSWLWVMMVAVITLNVVMRYILGEGRIEFEELQWHLYAIGFLIGLSSCYVLDGHVRVDVLYERFSATTKAWIEFYGTLLFMLPFLIVIIWFAVPFVAYSFSIGEVSEAPGGLPLRWAIKSILLIAMILLGLAVFARFTRVCALLFGARRPVSTTEQPAE